MVSVHIERFTVADPVHGHVPCVEVSPPAQQGPLPLCLFLYGGGGSSETLVTLAPLLEQAWRNHTLPECRVVTPDVGPFSFYLDDLARGMAWESFVAERLLDHLAAPSVALVGISMGGYGALKMAFARPRRFCAVAAVAPMIEPAVVATDVPLRNRYHYPPGVPPALLGNDRDPLLYAADHPAARARSYAAAIRAHDLAIYIDAGSRDVLHAHDGAEFLHRVLWDLDLPHEYRLLRDADHVGPTIVPRLEAAFTWVGARLAGKVVTDSDDQQGLRVLLEPARRLAARDDPTFDRVYGISTNCTASMTT